MVVEPRVIASVVEKPKSPFAVTVGRDDTPPKNCTSDFGINDSAIYLWHWLMHYASKIMKSPDNLPVDVPLP